MAEQKFAHGTNTLALRKASQGIDHLKAPPMSFLAPDIHPTTRAPSVKKYIQHMQLQADHILLL